MKKNKKTEKVLLVHISEEQRYLEMAIMYMVMIPW